MWVVFNVGKKQGGFNGVWKNWVIFKNEDNMLENPNLEFGFSLGGVGVLLGKEEMDI
jgi:hypothetical protein